MSKYYVQNDGYRWAVFSQGAYWFCSAGSKENAERIAAALNAQPQAEPVGEWVMVPREALERWRDAFAEELGAWDIDPPLHHVKTSHDEIDAMLTAPLGAAAPPRPQASAEDVALVHEALSAAGYSMTAIYGAAWQRIRASLGVGRE